MCLLSEESLTGDLRQFKNWRADRKYFQGGDWVVRSEDRGAEMD